MKKIIALATCALALAACTQKSATPTTDTNTPSTPVPVATKIPDAMMKKESTDSSMMKSDNKYTFKLAAVGASKQDGTATLEEVAGKVKVTIEVANASTTAEPAHIHMGKCALPGDVKYPLTNVVNGKSETTLPAEATMAKLMAMGDLSINLHKSATDLKTYMSCGDLNWKTAGAMMSPASSAKASASVKATATPKASATVKASATPMAQ
jgi:hypothetical protein